MSRSITESWAGSWRRPLWLCCSLAVLLIATAAPAQRPATVGRLVWAPQALMVGSPCLFTVELDGRAIGVKGRWMGHELIFAPRLNANESTTNTTTNHWYALAGVDVEAAPGQQEIVVEIALPQGGTLEATRTVEVLPSTYKTLALHVAGRFVEPDAATLARIAAEKQIKDAAFAQRLVQVEWSGSFIPPLHALTTETFGTRRVFNGETASIHRGLDFRARTGTPVVAANSGVVVLAQNLFYEGGYVVIDHGEQFTTMYMHLSKIGVDVGEQVSKGQQIGLSGATGRVTGPHLHFAARWQNAYLDPAILLQLDLSKLAPGVVSPK